MTNTVAMTNTYIMNPQERPFPGERIEWSADGWGGTGTVTKQIRRVGKGVGPVGVVVEIIDDITGNGIVLEPHEYTLKEGGERETRCAHETRAHIESVREKLYRFRRQIERRARNHDHSKFGPEEFPLFAEVTGELEGLTYGSDEYKAQLKKLGPALTHHYANNSHHPEHYENGIRGMDLGDLVEMFCDWLAATERHADGNILRSIEINEERFGIPPELSDIFRNTVSRWHT